MTVATVKTDGCCNLQEASHQTKDEQGHQQKHNEVLYIQTTSIITGEHFNTKDYLVDLNLFFPIEAAIAEY